MFLNIAMQIQDQFYKLIALGLGCVYGVQVFLNVGGVIKFIPSTGLTLPLVSYGGSSILCTIVMFAIIQGLYIMRQDEEGELNEQKSRGRKQKRDYSGRRKSTAVRSQQKPKIKSGQTGYRGHESGSGRPRDGASSRFDETRSRKSGKTGRNLEFLIITYLFLTIFIGMIGYFVYFQLVKSESIINSSYNSRLDLYAEHVIRGDITAADGTVLAKDNGK